MLGQIPNATPDQLGGWIVCLVGVLATVWLVRQLWVSFFPAAPPRPHIPRAETYVTKAELDALFLGLKNDLTERVNRLDAYIHESTHRLIDSQHTITLQLARLMAMDEARTGHRAPLTEDLNREPS